MSSLRAINEQRDEEFGSGLRSPDNEDCGEDLGLNENMNSEPPLLEITNGASSNPNFSHVRKSKFARSSIDLRRLPTDLLLNTGPMDANTNISTSEAEENEQTSGKSKAELSIVQRLCLNPKYTLRTQMLISFGLINLMTILFVVFVCLLVTYRTGQKVKSSQIAAFQSLTKSSWSITARYLAESLNNRLIPKDIVEIIREATQDRFMGGFQESDQFVPFPDAISGENIYPVIGPDLFLDWQVPRTVNETNYEEHVQEERWSFYKHKPKVSTESGGFRFQGSCDPNAAVGTALYWPECSPASNNITTGGSYNPSNLTSIVYRKGKDLVPLLKSIFESDLDIRELGIHFKTNGSGASVIFPAYPIDSRTFYTSVGCDWMNTLNPYDPSRPIGSPAEIAQCHEEGMVVSSRIYNPMENAWCRNQALNPESVVVRFERDFSTPENSHLVIGRAIFDRLTNDFLACTYIGVSLDVFKLFLKDNRITEKSHVSIARWDSEGEVLATSLDRTAGGIQPIHELSIGVTEVSFREVLSLVDYSTEWNASEVHNIYENHFIREHGFVVHAYPIPPVPAEFDSSYRPEFLVFVSISDEDVFRSVRQVNSSVTTTVTELYIFSFILGMIGLVATTAMILGMAKALTAPLEAINKATLEIINNFGSPTTAEDREVQIGSRVSNSTFFLSPRTELHQIVDEYNKMVTSFSGSLLTKTQRSQRLEIKNPFKSDSMFWKVYDSRTDQFRWDQCMINGMVDTSASPSQKIGCNRTENLDFIHKGRNTGNTTSSVRTKSLMVQKEVHGRKFSSPLFWWTVMLIVMPLLLFTISISAWVIIRIDQKFDRNVADAKAYFIHIFVEVMQLHATLRAHTVAGSTVSSVRDLYLLTRYFGWLAFDGLTKANSFTMMHSGADECKIYLDERECPYYQENAFCHCSWNDMRTPCTDDLSEDPRYRQISYFLVQSNDALSNGNRTKTSFPLVDYSPNTTAWWNDPMSVPGHNRTSHFPIETLYDRLRVSSAIPLFPVLYNYDKHKKSYIGNYIAFEADGLFLGMRGCPGFQFLHNWRSSEANKAYTLRPELCPNGKYGYDPRCREWYDTGKKLAEEQRFLYITSPYAFAGASGNAQSATSALVDPTTGEHRAQILVDFQASEIFDVLDGANTRLSPRGFPILITAEGSRNENTVLGPGVELNVAARKVSEVLLPYDYDCLDKQCRSNMLAFQSIESKMRRGIRDATNFTRSTERGSSEIIFLAYAPVIMRSIHPLDPSMFARGVAGSEYQVYSIGLCETEESLEEPFITVINDVNKQVQFAVVVISAAIAVAIIVILVVSYFMTSSITEPMLYLLDLIRCINKMNIHDEPTSVNWIAGPRDIVSVTVTMETLYKVVRAANEAFYVGDVEKAYYVLIDALRLFKKLGNTKAVGIASNNLGNIMLAMYQKLKRSEGGKVVGGLSLKKIIDDGMLYFYDAIRLGEKSYDEFYNLEGWTANCLDFMQHLANRYFNRAIFLLSVKGDHDRPVELVRLAIRDLEIARDMDLEVIAYGEDVGLNCENRTDKIFEVALNRARGHNVLFELGYPDEIMSKKGYPTDWDLKQRYNEMFDMIKSEAQKGESKLFDDVTILGRVQEVEGALIHYMMQLRDVVAAARIGIRMLLEDEYVLADSLSAALDAVYMYLDTMESDPRELSESKRMLEMCKRLLQKKVLEHLEDENRYSIATDLAAVSMSMSSRCVKHSEEQPVAWLIKQASGAFVNMENF